MIDTLQDFGFQTTGWQPGRIQHTILSACATAAFPFIQLGSALVRGAFNDLSTGSALTLYSKSRFDNTRTAALKTKGPFTINNTASVPYNVQIGQVVFTDTSGIEFTNTEAKTILASTSGQTLNVEAVLAGESGNIPNSSTLTLVTPLAGVSATNPSPGTDVNGDPLPWYSIQTGVDEESDSALRLRNSTKWGLLSVERTATAYENLALKQTGVEKVRVVHDNPRGPGSVDVYVAAASSVLGAGDMAAAQAAFADYTFGTTATWPPTITDLAAFPDTATRVYVRTPSTLELTINGVVYYDPAYTEAEVKANLKAVLDAFVQNTPLGGYDYSPGPTNVVTLNDVVQAIETTVGVRTSTLTLPAGNTLLSDNQLLTGPSDWFTGRITMTAVTS